MRIAVVGTVVADTIEQLDGSLATSLGGIAHSMTALASLAGGEHVIEPICRLGEDEWPRLERLATRLAGVTLRSVRRHAGPNPTVRLSYRGTQAPGERTEILQNPQPPLSEEEVAAADGADLVLVNFISGEDCTSGAMQRIRESCNRVYLDVHSLALGQTAEGNRFYRPRDDWNDWLGPADVTQCNLSEAATILGLDPHEAKAEEVVEGLVAMLGASERGGQRPELVALTAGAAGATALYRCDGDLRCAEVAAPSVPVVDPTGAGDAFGAACALAYLAGAEPESAVHAGVRAGSAACRYSGMPDPETFAAMVATLS